MTMMWSVLSVLFVLALWGMQSLLSQKSVTFTVWQWVGALAWLAWTLLGAALAWTFLSEGHVRAARAAGMAALIFGTVAAIVAAILAQAWIF
jgi:hypothetical protein